MFFPQTPTPETIQMLCPDDGLLSLDIQQRRRGLPNWFFLNIHAEIVGTSPKYAECKICFSRNVPDDTFGIWLSGRRPTYIWSNILFHSNESSIPVVHVVPISIPHTTPILASTYDLLCPPPVWVAGELEIPARIAKLYTRR